MDKQQLNEAILSSIGGNDIGIEIYFGLKNGELKKANFIDNVQQEIKGTFVNYIREHVVENTEYQVIALSQADNRSNVIYHFDYNTLPDDLNFFNEVLDSETQHELFSFSDDNLNEINFFLFLIGDIEHQIVLYKQLSPIHVYNQNSGLFVRKSNNEFVKVDSDFLRIVPGVEMFKVNGQLYILNLNLLERNFKIYDVIRSLALTQIEIIQGTGLIENPNKLSDLLGNTTFARKLSRISEHSPVLGKIPNENIISFTKTYRSLRKKFTYSEDNSQIKLTTKKSVELFIKLLNDDFLTSELTTTYYDSIAKDPLNEETE